MPIGIDLSLNLGRSRRARFPWSTSIVPTPPSYWTCADRGITLNGSAVAVWADQSGAGDVQRHALASGAQQPTYVASDPACGGRPSISFASGQLLRTGTWSQPRTQPCTWYVVGKPSNDTTSARVLIDGISANRQVLSADVTTGFGSLNAGSSVTGSVKPGGTRRIFCAVFNGASSALYVDNDLTAVGSGNAGALPLDGLTIGADNADGSGLLGSIAEVLCFPGAHTAAQRAAIMAYLDTRYRVGPIRVAPFGWLDAAKGITPNGSRVAGWADQSGNGRNVAQATSVWQPLFVASALNGKPAVRSDGINDWIKATVAVPQIVTVFTVQKVLSSLANQDIIWAFDAGIFLLEDSTPRTILSAGANVTYAQQVTNGVYGYVTSVLNTTASYFRENGIVRAGPANAGTGTGTSITIFALPNGTHSMNVEIAEFMMYPGALSTADIAAVEQYLASKYNL